MFHNPDLKLQGSKEMSEKKIWKKAFWTDEININQ